MARIGFIGLGNMGGAMSANLAKAGHDVRGFDIVPERLARAAGRGVVPAASNADAARDADFVFTMLPTGREVSHVLVTGDRVLDVVGPDCIVVDTSTTDLTATALIHEEARARGLRLIDSPVSGGMTGAEAATLTFMAGGDAAAIDAAEPVFLAMGKTLVRAGGPSAGQAVKVCNNMLLGISMIGVCEAISLGEAAGVEHRVLYDVISKSSGGCWAMTVNCPMPGILATSPSSRGFTPGFTAKLMLKDLTLAQDAAARTGAVAPLGEQARAIYQRFCEERDGDLDFSAMVEMVRSLRAPDPGTP